MPSRFTRFVISLCLSVGFAAGYGQTFTGTGGSIPGTTTTQTCFNQTVSGVGLINSSYGLAQVCVNITHPNDDELEIVLRAPDGTVVPLSLQNGGSGNNYSNTCFTATAILPVKFGNAPFAGNYLPEGHLGAVNNGQNANGTWSLCIQDRRTVGNAGTLTGWSLTFSNSPAPAPPALPACANTLPSTSSCATATQVCDFNGQCGTTSGTTVQNWPGSGLDGPCFGLQNNSFIRFVASANTASFSVWVPTTLNTAYNQGGIQMLFFSGTCDSGAVSTNGCYPHILPYSGSGQPLITVVYAMGLVPGNTYYLMIDGFNNDNCSFTIAANTGVNILAVTPAAPAVCTGSGVNLQASGGNGTYNWAPPAGLSTTTGANVTATPLTSTTYTVTSSTASGCPVTRDVTVTVNNLPAQPVASFAQPTCSSPAGSIQVTSPLGAGFSYTIDGSNFQTGTSFTNLAAGNYFLQVKDLATGCLSVITAVTINTAPAAPPAPVSSVIQPTCTVPTGTITITSPTGAGYQYSIDGVSYQASPVFAGLNPTTYTVWIRNAAGCTASSNVSINPAPAGQAAPPNIGTLQPDCFTATGTIIVTPPSPSVNIEYSINAVNYQASNTFSGLAPGNYSVTVRNTVTGCVSIATPVTVNAVPEGPAVPVASVTTQPSCTEPTGTITITSPVGSALLYSVNGVSYQAAPVFTSLAPADYAVTVKDNSTGCVSAANVLTVQTAPPRPQQPTVNSTQPGCSGNGGSITITSPLAAGLQYSIDGNMFQSSPEFLLVPDGLYTVMVKDAAGCTSPPTIVIILKTGAAPPRPVLALTQPQCPVLTGSITVTDPRSSNIEYSIDGVNYRSSPVFNQLAAGNYQVLARRANSTCISAATPFSINVLLPSQCATGSVGTIYFPSAFTPNGDGLNDVFGPLPRAGLAQLKQYRLRVYNRYGEMLFSSNDPFAGWDGSFKHAILANYSYTWVAQYEGGNGEVTTQKGTVLLVK